ncbi:hypothetical protein P4B35_23645, partial [Pontiellaceae bacterium B12227]|nr:hypothetical protein [Pontiellaceae bacterium B12227]
VGTLNNAAFNLQDLRIGANRAGHLTYDSDMGLIKVYDAALRGDELDALLQEGGGLPVETPQLDILVLGSAHSFSERPEVVFKDKETTVIHEKPFNPAGIASQLESILAQDPMIEEAVNVDFEDIYTSEMIDVIYSLGQRNDYLAHCYSLAQYFFWPDGKEERLANLRGEGSHGWDYIVLSFDPYILANFPGMVAEGVKLIQQEVAKSSSPAQIVLLAQWPEDSSPFDVEYFNEVVYRVGNSAGVAVVPAGKAWDSLSPQDAAASHPTPDGEYLAAASIYSRIFDRNAGSSGYSYDDTIADHAFSTVQANATVDQYTGEFDVINPFLMKQVSKRVVFYNQTGSSTEIGIKEALERLDDVMGISFSILGYIGDEGTRRWDFNYGRAGDLWEDAKDYQVDPSRFDRSYGFPMHYYGMTSAPTTMQYGIDKIYIETILGLSYDDGTDLGTAYNMIRPGTRELNIPEDVRGVPIRLMWLKMAQAFPGFHPLRNDSHMSYDLDNA